MRTSRRARPTRGVGLVPELSNSRLNVAHVASHQRAHDLGHKRRLTDGHTAHHDARARARCPVRDTHQCDRAHRHARALPPRAALKIVASREARRLALVDLQADEPPQA